MLRLAVRATDDIWAMAAPMSVPGSKYTRRVPMPLIESLSIEVIPLTVVEKARSVMSGQCAASMSSALRPA